MNNRSYLVYFFGKKTNIFVPKLKLLPLPSIFFIFALVASTSCSYLPTNPSNNSATRTNVPVANNNSQTTQPESLHTQSKSQTNGTSQATNTPTTEPSEQQLADGNNSKTKQILTNATQQNKIQKPDLLSSKMEAETLYDLIVAEMAGKANRLNVTLGNYLKQAHYTRDPKIIARATRIAKYMAAHQATLNAAKLWLEIEPDNIEAHQAVTIQLIRNSKYNEALIHVDKLLLLSGEPNFDFLIHHSRRVDRNARQTIITGLNTLTTSHPENARLWFTKAILEDLQKARKAALVSVEHSLELEPNYVTAKIFRAKTLQSLGQIEEALKTLKQAVKKHASHKRLRIVYARLLIKLNKLDKAQEQFEYLIKRNPNDSDLLLSLALLSWENELDKQAKKYLYQLLKTGKKYTYLIFRMSG
ncbi:MAG: tetratricopeptide repeat protein [Pseudomonadales bacterium]|nr:tetratricopeptide repeat protein [Pseudomonadales bacterium]